MLARFANRSAGVLVATDIAVRGLDIAQLEAVVNGDITPDPATHTHRIGRTGRVGAFENPLATPAGSRWCRLRPPAPARCCRRW